MNISDTAIKVIEHFEGDKLIAYKCSAGVWTIGKGHTGSDVYKGLVITQERSDELFRIDIDKYESVVEQLLGSVITQNIFDACVLFAYNCGLPAFKNSTLLKLLKAGRTNLASSEFEKWDKADGSKNGKDDDGDGLIDEAGEKQRLEGLARRRRAEKALLLGKTVDFK